MMEITKISDIYNNKKELSQLEKIKVGGWVKSVRESKDIIFITLNDGSTLKMLQVVSLQLNFPQILLNKIKFASYLEIKGCLILTPDRQQPFELRASYFDFEVNEVNDNYPLQKKNIPLEVVRNYPHLRVKTNYFLALFRLRHNVSKAIHDFFHQEGFYYVPTPTH